jgi:glucose dehydrogenase
MQTLHGLEATPLVKDGVMYLTSTWSVVYALDARTGAIRWRYDPAAPKDHDKFMCCGVVNRGVALYRGRVYVGTMDGRLVALDERRANPCGRRKPRRLTRRTRSRVRRASPPAESS